jgi:hypothetical protein
MKVLPAQLETFVRKVGNVSLHDVNTMAEKPYSELFQSLGVLDNFVKKSGKSIDIYDSQLTEHDTLNNKNIDSTKVLVSVLDMLTGKTKNQAIQYETKSDVPFLRQVYQAVGEMINGSKKKPIDDFVDKSKLSYKNYQKLNPTFVIKDKNTIVGNSYNILVKNSDKIKNLAKQEHKRIMFEDARVLTRDDEFDDPIIENSLMSKVMVTVKDLKTGKEQGKLVDYFEDSEKTPFMKKISNALGELITGKSDTNFDNELGLNK